MHTSPPMMTSIASDAMIASVVSSNTPGTHLAQPCQTSAAPTARFFIGASVRGGDDLHPSRCPFGPMKFNVPPTPAPSILRISDAENRTRNSKRAFPSRGVRECACRVGAPQARRGGWERRGGRSPLRRCRQRGARRSPRVAAARRRRGWGDQVRVSSRSDRSGQRGRAGA